MAGKDNTDGVFPSYTRAEELADAVVHICGIAAGVIGSFALFAVVVPGAPAHVAASAAIYAAGLLAMLIFSAAYNMVWHLPRKRLLRRLDRAAIFFMIAGTYTPFAAVHLSGPWGWGLLALVWCGALAGILLALLADRRGDRVAMALYLALGWSILVAIEPLIDAVTFNVALLLLIGGVLYTLGVLFHVWRSLRFQNAIWHALVLAAAACHYAAVFAALAGYGAGA